MWTQNAQLSELDVGTFVTKMFEHKLKEPVQINCGLIAFTTRGGIAAADPILIDTSKNVVTGKGGFSFHDEAIDLAFRADGKKFSLFSLQSPVGIEGSFAKPTLDVLSPQLFARAGAADRARGAGNPGRGAARVHRSGRCEVGRLRPGARGRPRGGAAHHQGQAAQGCGQRACRREVSPPSAAAATSIRERCSSA